MKKEKPASSQKGFLRRFLEIFISFEVGNTSSAHDISGSEQVAKNMTANSIGDSADSEHAVRVSKKKGNTQKKWLQAVYTAWVGVATHKIRSFLTILGVVIGVAAVISLMSVGRGTQANILANVQGLGANLLFVSPGSSSTSAQGVRSAMGSATTLTAEDATAIRDGCSYVLYIAPVQQSGTQVIYENKNTFGQITGSTPEYFDVNSLEMAAGEFFTENQYDSAQKVIVLGSIACTNLFGEEEGAEETAVGQTIRCGSSSFKVIGVLKSKGTSMLGASDTAMYTPLTTLRQSFTARRTPEGKYAVSQILIALTDQKYGVIAKSEITEILRVAHKIAEGEDDDFSVTSQEDVVKTITAATSSMTLLLGAIAAISLLVGGIGVMNIMLVSVIERTREIGIRKALGAREPDIWMQFLIEASILTLSGGLVGVLTGWGISMFIENLGSMTTVVSADIVILAISVSVGIGVFFGFYPAWQASRLNPIEALRSE